MAKKRYPDNPTFVRVGPKAFSFADPYSGLTVRKNQVVELVTREHKTSGKIRNALRGGHLVIASEKEYKEYMATKEEPVVAEEPAEESLEDFLEAKTKAQLAEYYRDNYQVTDDEVEAFAKLKKEEMVQELLELEEG